MVQALENRVLENEKDIKSIQMNRVELKTHMAYIQKDIALMKVTDKEILEQQREMSESISILVSSRSMGKEVLRILLSTLGSGVVLALAWFAVAALK